MSVHATADTGLADRHAFITKKLAERLVDDLDRLDRDLHDDDGVPVTPEELRRRVGDAMQLACVLLDELRALEMP